MKKLSKRTADELRSIARQLYHVKKSEFYMFDPKCCAIGSTKSDFDDDNGHWSFYFQLPKYIKNDISYNEYDYLFCNGIGLTPRQERQRILDFIEQRGVEDE